LAGAEGALPGVEFGPKQALRDGVRIYPGKKWFFEN